MKFRSFKHTYHDGQLASFALGPRREITLEIALNPVWNKEGPSIATVRFGGIENYDLVAEFFRGLPQPPKPDAYIAEIYGLRYVGKDRIGSTSISLITVTSRSNHIISLSRSCGCTVRQVRAL